MLSLSPTSSSSAPELAGASRHPTRAPNRVSRAVQRALDFIDACFAEPISLSELAAVAQLSISRFAVRFSAEIGVSPQQYVRLVRVRHAQCLLRRGLPPSIVATEVGFFDQSHLCRHFKRVLGRTPGEWLSANG
ncbi:AraC-like DNA-binding protein [Paraburkholderia sp. MM5496-R1]|uniref:Transcriptional regulator, AraC family n=1 Tax=Paraburkholderia tuberum TaxID=157910 RepID=A0A1H1KB31_9BURK|nr:MULTISPECIES: AraC family transcriptional regulator [Paraburkholderia]MBB5460746.1 AraC-like DNA-binding protein [Paraburkholderia sp. Cpub6]MBC8732521.1 helix-turn-helix transcriptional regulator [Paraburkholderia sp. UCT2]SDR59548.1 transcriptional regulator, AraC family [Paraburkholderia tuberum]